MNIPGIPLIAKLIRRGNHAQAELLARIILMAKPEDPHAHLTIAWAASQVGLGVYTRKHLSTLRNLEVDVTATAAELNISGETLAELCISTDPVTDEPAENAPRFLLIKAWGYGFWSDVLHVLAGCLLAEITDRTPVVHWGDNSLYFGAGDKNAFCRFFSFPDTDLAPLAAAGQRFFPPKWHGGNLATNNNAKLTGDWSKISALDLLAREEEVCVLDYYVGVINLLPYIPAHSRYHGKGVVDIYRGLVNHYLDILPEIRERADAERARLTGNAPTVAVHVRGSDKVREFADIETLGARYAPLIERHLAELPDNARLFLMTDDERVLSQYQTRYGDRVVATDCRRTSGTTGVHYLAEQDAAASAIEVMVDTLIASKADRFVGNGYTNPSLMVCYLKQWQADHIDIVGGDFANRFNTYLYKRP